MVMLLEDTTTRPFSRFTRKYTFIILAVLSDVIGAIWVAIDTYTGAAIIVDVDGNTNEYVFAIQSMLIGVVVSIIFVLILWLPINRKPIDDFITKFQHKSNRNTLEVQDNELSQKKHKTEKRKYSFLGQYLDPLFHGIILPTKKMFLWLFLSGLFSGINTVIYFILIKSMPLAVFLPASQFVVVYLLLADLFVEKSLPCAVEIQSIIMIVLGVILAAVDFSAGFSSISFIDILLVFFVFNVAAAIYVVFQKKVVEAKDKKGNTLDPTNVRLWTLLFMTFFTVVFSLPFMKAADWITFANTFKPGIIPITLSMLLVYIARIFYVRALAMGKMSIVNSLASVSVIVGIPINLIGYFIWPDYFSIPTGPNAWGVWMLWIIGAILVFTGIVALSMSEIKIIVFAKVKYGKVWDMEKIKKIPGVEKVSVTTGKYDLLIILRLRSIGRGYQPIVEQLEKLPFLEDIKSTTIYKEWNA